MRSLIFFFQSPVNGSFRDQFEKLNGELLYLACPTRAFRKSSSWSKSKLINARGVVAIFLLSSSRIWLYWIIKAFRSSSLAFKRRLPSRVSSGGSDTSPGEGKES